MSTPAAASGASTPKDELDKAPFAELPAVERDESKVATRPPWRVSLPPMLMVLFFNCACYWFSSSLGPIKSTLKKELGINNAQYGVISTSSSLVNTVFPFFSGVAMDYYGAEWCSLASSSVIFLGAVLAGIGASVSSYGLLVTGEVVLGFGQITIETAQLKILSHLFFSTHLGLALGLNNAVNRVIVVVSKATAIPIADASNWTGVIWVPAFIAGGVLLVNAFYVFYESRLPTEFRPLTGRQAAQMHGQGQGGLRAELRKAWVVVTGLPAFFWFLTLTQILQNGTVQTNTALQADMLTVTRGKNSLTAGYASAVAQVPVFVLAPLTGAFIDRYGCTFHFVPASAVLFIILFALMGWTEANAWGLTVLQGIALAINLLPLNVAVTMIVPSLHQIGTAQGTYQSFINSAHVIVSTAAGAIQDRTPTGKHSYDGVLAFFMAIKALDVVFGLSYIFLDRYHLQSLLTKPHSRLRKTAQPSLEYPDAADEKEKGGEKADKADGEEKPYLLRPSKTWTAAGLTSGAALTVVAWVVYLVYSQGS